MSKKKKKTVNSWHSITQSKQKRSITPEAKVRKLKSFARVSAITLVSLACLGLLGYGGYVMYEATDQFNLLGGSSSLKKIKLETDGVLTTKWLSQNIQLPKEKSLMQVNIFELKNKLEAQPQIKEVIIERDFPDNLKLTLKEYQPVVKVIAYEGKKKRLLLISREGHVYPGAHYSRAFLEQLPFLSGVRLANSNGVYKPLAGMSTIASLLELAQKNYSYIYDSFQEISCKKFTGKKDDVAATIKIRTRDSKKIVFTAENFPLQLSRLDYIIQYSKEQKIKDVRTIDLTLGDHAVIQRISGTHERYPHL